MLKNLHIQNVALIEACEIEFKNGLNIMTGETGAGKSMVLGSLQFVLGQKVSKKQDFIRKNATIAQVEVSFLISSQTILSQLEENGIEMEDFELVISRSLNQSGKSVCRMNGTMISLSFLREFSANLIDIYGQHEYQSLLNAKKHIHILDRFCGEEFLKLLGEYQIAYGQMKQIQKEIDQLKEAQQNQEQKMDMYRFQIEEIEEADLKIEEEEELLKLQKSLSHTKRLHELMEESLQILYDGTEEMQSAGDGINRGLILMREGMNYDEALEPFYEELENISVRLDDICREMKRYEQSLEEQPYDLDTIQNRLDLLYKLKKKYGNTIEAVLQHYEKISKEFERMEDSDVILQELEVALKKEEEKVFKLAKQLTKKRKNCAKEVEQQIEASLQDMEMKYAKFEISIIEQAYHAHGQDEIEFLFSANSGESLKSLAKIASGGEMSRVMLALKAILVDTDEIGTFVFDEIDTGISGRTAGKVGEKMNHIAKQKQIICITHLPQIACMSDCHFLIEKETKAEITTTSVTQLGDGEEIQEIARLIGSSEITETTIAAAKELRKRK